QPRLQRAEVHSVIARQIAPAARPDSHEILAGANRDRWRRRPRQRGGGRGRRRGDSGRGIARLRRGESRRGFEGDAARRQVRRVRQTWRKSHGLIGVIYWPQYRGRRKLRIIGSAI